jgi:ketosteroid isomerase-like protein
MSDHRERNAEIVREAAEAFRVRDMGGLLAFLDPDVESHVSPPLMNAGTWTGHEGFLAMAASWEEPWSEINYETGEIETPDDNHVLAHIHQNATGAGSGVPVELDVVYMVELRDGRAVRMHIYPDRDAALAAVAR